MLTLDTLFSDYAVLQRDKEICIWGHGDDDSAVTVSIQGHSTKTVVKDGKWTAVLPCLTVSKEEELTVTDGTDHIVVKHIAIGEVWIAGGQSNMEFPMRNLREYRSIKKTNQPLIRLYGVPRISYRGQLEDDDFSEYSIWRPCTPEHLWFYSAAPYYFAMMLYEKYGVPIGILNCNYGGTRASSWADRSILEKTRARIWIDEYEKNIMELDIDKYTEEYKANPVRKPKKQDHSRFRDKMWKGFSAFELFFWKPIFKLTFPGIPPVGPLDPNSPSALYNHMVKPIAPYTVRGVIWYQGESDDEHADVYDEAMGAVIDSWRRLWSENLPFLMVQLAPYEGSMGMMAQNYVLIREKQEQLTQTRDAVYITNVMDAGMRTDIHPKQKKPVGERLALLAMGKVYNEDILCEAPALTAYKKNGNQIIMTFANSGEGLSRDAEDIDSLDVIIDGNNICGVTMTVGQDSMILENDAFKQKSEVTIRYGKRNYCECHIKNSAGIPVKPFAITVRG